MADRRDRPLAGRPIQQQARAHHAQLIPRRADTPLVRLRPRTAGRGHLHRARRTDRRRSSTDAASLIVPSLKAPSRPCSTSANSSRPGLRTAGQAPTSTSATATHYRPPPTWPPTPASLRRPAARLLDPRRTALQTRKQAAQASLLPVRVHGSVRSTIEVPPRQKDRPGKAPHPSPPLPRKTASRRPLRDTPRQHPTTINQAPPVDETHRGHSPWRVNPYTAGLTSGFPEIGAAHYCIERHPTGVKVTVTAPSSHQDARPNGELTCAKASRSSQCPGCHRPRTCELSRGGPYHPTGRLTYDNPLREHLISVHADVSGMPFSIRQVGVDSPVSSRDILLAIAQWIIVRDLCGRAS